MSKWLNDDLFKKFVEERKKEDEKQDSGKFQQKWPTPAAGTSETPETYIIRFLPDKKGIPYKKFYYHMFKVGEKFKFFLCPKTHNFDNYCPICAATSKLWTGSDADKEIAKVLKRKEKFVGNIFIVDDPRDAKADDDNKQNGTVKLYEFPSKIESKLKNEILDTKNGIGPCIFDPGSEGFDFILKVKSTKPINNQSWPEYSDSTFARRASAIGTDKEIDEIMKSVVDLIEYINGMAASEDEMIEALKAEFVYEVIEAEYLRRKNANAVNTAHVKKETPADNTKEKETTTEEVASACEEDVSEEDLLNQLNDLDSL